MSFRDNLQHLRATRNMTQEQLAMLIGVSRQSVSKWEAEKSYPEMDKLLKICELFGCSLDDLVSGDLTSRPADPSQSVATSTRPLDVTGYDEAMYRFANRLSSGIAIIILGFAFAALLQGASPLPNSDPDAFSLVAIFVCVGIGLAFIIPSAIEHGAFRKAHPFIEDFYTPEQKNETRRKFSTGLVVGIALILVAVVIPVLLDGLTVTPTTSSSSQTAGATLFGAESWSGFIFFVCVAAGVWTIVRSAVLHSRIDVSSYNRDSLADMPEDQIEAMDDPALRERARKARRDNGIYGAIMGVATAIGLLLLFVPAFHATMWFWVVWPVGGVICGAIAAYRQSR